MSLCAPFVSAAVSFYTVAKVVSWTVLDLKKSGSGMDMFFRLQIHAEGYPMTNDGLAQFLVVWHRNGNRPSFQLPLHHNVTASPPHQ